jgi:hypothetical protein
MSEKPLGMVTDRSRIGQTMPIRSRLGKPPIVAAGLRWRSLVYQPVGSATLGGFTGTARVATKSTAL